MITNGLPTPNTPRKVVLIRHINRLLMAGAAVLGSEVVATLTPNTTDSLPVLESKLEAALVETQAAALE